MICTEERKILNGTRQIGAYDVSIYLMCIHSNSIYLFIYSEPRSTCAEEREHKYVYSSFFGAFYALCVRSPFIEIKRGSVQIFIHIVVDMLVNKTIFFFFFIFWMEFVFCRFKNRLVFHFCVFFPSLPSLLQIQFNGIQHFSFHNSK